MASQTVIQPDYGTDIWCTDDLDPMFRTVRSLDTVAQAIVRRLQSPLGSLFLDQRYGLDVRGMLSGSTSATGPATATFVSGQIRAQILKDERVETVLIESSTYDSTSRAVLVRLRCFTSAGPFALALALTPTNLDVIIAP